MVYKDERKIFVKYYFLKFILFEFQKIKNKINLILKKNETF